MAAPPINTNTHEITHACADVHCHTHHIDEPADQAYITCFECGHVYRTALELWWAHLHAVLRIAGRDLRSPLNAPWWAELDAPWWQRGRTAAVLMVLHAVVGPARRITFCQHCIHDF